MTLTNIKYDSQTAYIEDVDNSIYLVINQHMVLFPTRRITMPLNAMFFMSNNYVVHYDGVEITIILEGSLSNLIRVYTKQMVAIPAGTRFLLDGVNALITTEIELKPIQIILKNARMGSNITFWFNTEQLIDHYVKLFGGQIIKGHWALKYGRLKINNKDRQRNEDEWIDKVRTSVVDAEVSDIEIEDVAYANYRYEQSAKHQYVYCAMPAQYEIKTIEKIINMYEYRGDMLELEESMVNYNISNKKNEDSNLWFARDYGIIAGYNSFLIPEYNKYIEELKTTQLTNIEDIKASHVVTVMITSLPSNNDLKILFDTIMQLSMTPVKVMADKKIDLDMYKQIQEKIKLREVVKKSMNRNMMSKPILLIECVSYCRYVVDAIKYYESSHTYLFPNYSINQLLERESEKYKRECEEEEEENENKRKKI